MSEPEAAGEGFQYLPTDLANVNAKKNKKKKKTDVENVDN